MGQHTWFLKSAEIYDKMEEIDNKLFKLEESLGELEYFENDEVLELQIKSDKLYDENETELTINNPANNHNSRRSADN